MLLRCQFVRIEYMENIASLNHTNELSAFSYDGENLDRKSQIPTKDCKHLLALMQRLSV